MPKGGRAVATFETSDGVWTLYELPSRGYEGESPFWIPVKLMLPPDTRKRWHQRRSYRLRWNADELRMRREYESLTLERTHPDLYLRVETFMSLSYDCAWLIGSQGMTVAEIEAERVRLIDMARNRRRSKKANAA